MNDMTALYQRIRKVPLGARIFSIALTLRAPFFATIRPMVNTLEYGRCRVTIKDRRAIRNHIGTINAGALCTLCELTAGLAVQATIPSHLRWIPKEMTVKYLKKAQGEMEGVCSFDPFVLSPGDVRIPVEIKDSSNEKVLDGEVVFYLSERKERQN
jgi:acyl-coenzyme A thioesterase PaaI-like protein